MKRRYIILSVTLIAIIMILSTKNIGFDYRKLSGAVPSSKERLHFLFTGTREENDSAESILVESNGQFGLIDGGNPLNDPAPYNVSDLPFNGQVVASYLSRCGVSKLKFIILTHDHVDHAGGIAYLAEQGYVDSNTVFIYRELNTSRTDEAEWYSQYFFNKAKNAMISKNAKMLEISDHSSSNLSKISASYVSTTSSTATNHIKFNFGNFTFKLFNIGNYGPTDPEDRKAMVILMTNSGKKALFTSEAGNYNGVLTDISKYVGKVDFEKIAHYDNFISVPLYMLRNTSPDKILITGKFTSGTEYIHSLGLALAYHNETSNFFMGNEDSSYPIVVTFDSNDVKLYKNNNGNYTEITSVNITAKPRAGWMKVNDLKPVLSDSDINDYVYIKNNKMATGFITVGTNNEIYYMSEESSDTISKGAMVRGWKIIDKNWYYFSKGAATIYGTDFKDGQLVTGWYQDSSGKWYYLDPSSNPKGQMVKGFKKISSKWYYFSPKSNSSDGIVSGQMMTKNVTIDGVTFTIGTNGVVSNFNGLVNKPTNSNCINPEYNGSTQNIINASTGYTYSNNSKKDVGTYEVTATLSSGYAWSDSTAATVKFNCSISAKNISGATVTVSDQTYTGSALTPNPTVKVGSTTLTKGTDYTVSYSNNVNVGTATVTITGKGNYTGTARGTFTIEESYTPPSPTKIDKPTTSKCSNPTYNGTNQVITKSAGTGYTFINNSYKDAGSHPVTARLSSGYTWQDGTTSDYTFNCSISALSISGATVTVSDQTYTGSALTPDPTVKVGNTTLTKGTDYTVSYSNNVNVGTATVTITGKGNYTGTATGTFTIEESYTPPSPTKIDKPTTSKCSNPTYNGTNQVITKSAGTGYTFINNSYKDAGSHPVTARLSSGYAWQDGTTSDYTFNCSISAMSISEATVTVSDQTYTGLALTPDPTVKVGNTTLTKGTDYTVSYSNNVNVGTATVTITGKGNYTDAKVGTFAIVSPSITDITIIDTSNVTKDGNILIIRIPTGIKLTKSKVEEMISIPSNFTIKDKNNNEITASNQGVGTNSKIVSNDKTYNVVVRGDINGDGELSIIDLINIYGYMNDIDKGTPTKLNQNQIIACDFNRDNIVDILDLINVYNRMKSND